MAIDDNDQIYVAGDKAILIFGRDGKQLSEIEVQSEPNCLTVGGAQHATPGQIYVGMKEHIEVFSPKGEHLASWPTRGPEAYFASITASDIEIWVADSGNRHVWRYDMNGKLLKPVGQSGAAPGGAEFAVTDHDFDLAAAYHDLVYIVNPGLLRVEGYRKTTGEYEFSWGHGSPAVADFFGRSNPARLAILPNGRFVTAEKGIPRVKIYTHMGEFETVVAGPDSLAETPAGVGGDRHGRILVLDAKANKMRIFEKK
jgi:hypothetical protein